jgi:two-component system KDP operon response regulator KdpE
VVRRVLLVDLEAGAAGELAEKLSRSSFCVDVAGGTEAAAFMLGRRAFDVAVVIVGEQVGGELEEALVTLPDVPRVVIAVARDEGLAVRALEAGADSVLGHPISRRELAARLEALISSTERAHRWRPPSPSSYRVGDLTIDPETHSVRRNGSTISLTPKEFRLLLGLASRAGQVVSHERLLKDVWGESNGAHADILRLYIRYLRRKLEDDHRRPRLLVNHRGVGYRLVAGTEPARNGAHRIAI